jgi:hypothetical protein
VGYTRLLSAPQQERTSAFNLLCKEEQLDAEKLKQVIDRYVYTGQEPLPDPDIIDLITRPLKLSERAPKHPKWIDLRGLPCSGLLCQVRIGASSRFHDASGLRS